MNIPKFTVRGNKNIAAIIIFAALGVFVGGVLSADTLQNKQEELENNFNSTQIVNIDALDAQRNRLSAENIELNNTVKSMKEETIIQFDKDVFSTAISTFADLNNIVITKFKQNPEMDTGDGFYKVSYDISMSGSIYGMMEFMNLIDVMGYQSTIEYFSFRQNGTFEWLERETNKNDLLTWIKEARNSMDNEELEQMKALATKIENDDYDYGETVMPSTTATHPVEEKKTDPLDGFIGSLLQAGENVGSSVSASRQTDNVSNTQTQAEREIRRKKALEEKEADKEKLREYLENNYPEGTMIKKGQLIIPTLDGSMVFDVGISFVGNREGKKVSDEYLTLLLPTSITTSADKSISVVLNGKTKKVPSIIEGVDVSALDGINISDSSKFTVSWNNNQLSKDIVEQCLSLKEDKGVGDLKRAAAEIRFLQKNGKTDLEIMKYLIFLYQYIYG